MASITRNRNGSYTVRWVIGRDVTGKVRRDSKTFADKNEAIAQKIEVERYAIGTGKESLAARGNQWIDDRLALGKIGYKTAVGYRQKLDAWGKLLGTKPYKRLSTADIERAFSALARGAGPSGRPLSARTLDHYRTVLATFFTAMTKKREIAYSPMIGVETIQTPKRKTKRAPTREELTRMIEVADTHGAAFGQLAFIMRLGSHLGLRRGELCALMWSDVDFSRMTVTIRRAATQPGDGKIYFKPPKTEAGVRKIAMVEPTAELLRAQRKLVAEWRIAAGANWADNDLVVCSPIGEVLNLEQISRAAGIVRDRAGVSRDVLPLHGQRHYALTELHRAGVDPLTLQARAGHADLRSTATYIMIDEAKDRAAAECSVGSLI